MDCIFCKIIAGEIPSTKVYEDDKVYAFKDINPQAPVHVLVVPKTHICCADKIDAQNSVYVAKIFESIPKIAAQMGLTNGYRIRRAAIDHNIPLITNARLASAFINAFCNIDVNELPVKSWDEFK